MKPARDYITIPELSRFALIPQSTLKRLLSRTGTKPDQHVVAGNGLLPLFARSRLSELLAIIERESKKI